MKPSLLTPDEMEAFGELAGKFEYDAHMSRADAEKMALEAVLAKRTGRNQARALAQRLRQ